MILIQDRTSGEDSQDNNPDLTVATLEEAWAYVEQFILPGTGIQDADTPCILPLTRQRLQKQLDRWGAANIWYDGWLDPVLYLETIQA